MQFSRKSHNNNNENTNSETANRSEQTNKHARQPTAYCNTQIVPSVGDAVTEEIGSSPRITAFFLELVRVASCRGVSIALYWLLHNNFQIIYNCMYNSKKQTKTHDDGETILNVQVYLNSYETRSRTYS